MSYQVPRTTGQALSQTWASTIETQGMGQVLLAHCSRLLEIQESRIPSISPTDAQSAVRSQLDSIKDRLNAQWSMVENENDPIDLGVAVRVNVSVFQTYQISRQIDDLVGDGPTAEFVLAVAESFGSTVDKLTAGAGNILASAESAVTGILGGAGYAVWVVYGLAIILGVGLFYSLKKGVIPK
jgi:hypothetical protein